MLFRARQFEFRFPRPTLLMGVINVTPDSFSDGGSFANTTAAIDHGLRLVGEGADLLDVGGESTRPGAASVEESEELRRVIPVVAGLVARTDRPVSIDTCKPAVARAALEAGAAIVNDVAANRPDPAMWEIVAAAGAGYVAMHMQGTPLTMQAAPQYQDVVAEVADFFGERLERLAAAGVPRDHVVLDPGIGFGKSVSHNLALLAGLNRLMKWARPLLLGVSRKSLIDRVAGPAGPTERLPGSLAAACLGVASGVALLRVHDIAATRQAVRFTEAVRQHTIHGSADVP